MDRPPLPPDDPHEAIELLLPWYVSGTIDPAERDRVDAHLATCAACRAGLDFEQRLGARVATMPLAVEQDWSRMRARLAALPAPPRRWALPRAGWLVAAQVLLLAGAVAAFSPLAQPAAYHALGNATPAAAMHGNALVMVRGDMPVATLGQAMTGIGARLVDGPTETGAFVLHVPAATRDAALATLRARPGVTMAEPIDP